MRRISRTRFFAACCEEPFRIFFPLGLLAGVMGVSLWPLYFAGVHKFYPGVMHARLMVEGFMAAFVFGFLGTAGPRLTSTPHLSRSELGTLLALYAGVVATQIAERYILGDALFLVLLVCFATLMGKRFARRGDLPPPGFVLVAMGFATAIAGTLLTLIGATGKPLCIMLGGTLMNQAFVLFLVLGVGSFLLPRFLSLPPRPEFPESRTPTKAWLRSAALAVASGRCDSRFIHRGSFWNVTAHCCLRAIRNCSGVFAFPGATASQRGAARNPRAMPASGAGAHVAGLAGAGDLADATPRGFACRVHRRLQHGHAHRGDSRDSRARRISGICSKSASGL